MQIDKKEPVEKCRQKMMQTSSEVDEVIKRCLKNMHKKRYIKKDA